MGARHVSARHVGARHVGVRHVSVRRRSVIDASMNPMRKFIKKLTMPDEHNRVMHLDYDVIANFPVCMFVHRLCECWRPLDDCPNSPTNMKLLHYTFWLHFGMKKCHVIFLYWFMILVGRWSELINAVFSIFGSITYNLIMTGDFRYCHLRYKLVQSKLYMRHRMLLALVNKPQIF